jgi:hypothetical protein
MKFYVPRRELRRRRPASRASLPILGLLALSACAPAPRSFSAAAAAPVIPAIPCSVDLDSAKVVVRLDYAGYADKIRGRELAFANASEIARSEARDATDSWSCVGTIQRWLAFFRDPHLMVWGSGVAMSDPPANAAAELIRSSDQDGGRPAIYFPDDSTTLLRLPDFALRQAAVIDSLVAHYHAWIVARPFLIVDVRRNGGGWTGSYASVSRLLYTRPILVHGWDTWSSEGNITAMRDGLSYEGIPDEVAEAIRAVLPKMESNPGAFVALEENRELRRDTIFPLPRAVAIVIDRGCASSCELFVLEAAQSSKVTILGRENTHGALDYGHIRTVYLPSRARALRVPIARSHRLSEASLDLMGIAPQVRIASDAGDPVEYAMAHLRGAHAAEEPIAEHESAGIDALSSDP